jgi:hypothetical protein
MTLHKLFFGFRPLTTNLLVFALVFAGSLALTAQERGARQQRDSGQRGRSSTRAADNGMEEAGFVTYADGEKSVCRDMSLTETEALQRELDQLGQMRVISRAERQEALRDTPWEFQAEGVNGLTITLRGTAQLDSFPEAKNAFIRAAAQWEAQIRNPISIIVDVDYGPTRFGTPYPSGVLGSTGTSITTQSYSNVRTHLVNSAGSAAETTLYNALPATSVNTDVGTVSSVRVPLPLARALGIAAADGTSADASIGFNSNFQFDFDPSDGISSGRTDFDAVAVHEMGHALGFISNVGGGTTSLSVWDIFRFRPGTTMATFTTAQRILSTGGEHRFYDGQPELACSTGGPSGSGGDGRQASHWKDDSYTGVTIGIMDPTIASGQRKTMTSNDLRMLESLGYTISGTLPTPCSFTLSPTSASFGTAGGSGSVVATASASTCTRTATSNASWLTLGAGASGTGTGTVNYTVAANSGGSRTGTLTIGGQTFTVNQSGCSFIVSYSQTSFPSTASTGSITVTASGTNCAWTASDNRSWITVTPTSGTGTRTVTFSLTANTRRLSRTGRITIAGTQITITQAGR